MNDFKANVAVGGSWITWFTSHVVDINAVLQFFAFLAAIACSILAARYYYKKTP